MRRGPLRRAHEHVQCATDVLSTGFSATVRTFTRATARTRVTAMVLGTVESSGDCFAILLGVDSIENREQPGDCERIVQLLRRSASSAAAGFGHSRVCTTSSAAAPSTYVTLAGHRMFWGPGDEVLST